MRNTKRWRSLLKGLIRLWMMVPLLSYPFVAAGADAEKDAVRAGIEGVYVLEEWRTASGVFRPTQVEGRAVFLNGTITVILHDRMKESPQTTIASYGIYMLTLTDFSYSYTERSVFTITPSSITASRKLPWEGMRRFDIVLEGNAVRLRSQTGPQDFLFTPEGMTYSDASAGTFVGKRVYRRIVAE
jgi:hypothetical protein